MTHQVVLKVLLTSKQKFHFSMKSQCNATLISMSTKPREQPDASPCRHFLCLRKVSNNASRTFSSGLWVSPLSTRLAIPVRHSCVRTDLIFLRLQLKRVILGQSDDFNNGQRCFFLPVRKITMKSPFRPFVRWVVRGFSHYHILSEREHFLPLTY